MLEIDADTAPPPNQEILRTVAPLRTPGGGPAVDADDVCTHVRKQGSAVWRRADAGELDDLDSVESTHAFSFSRRASFVAFEIA